MLIYEYIIANGAVHAHGLEHWAEPQSAQDLSLENQESINS